MNPEDIKAWRTKLMLTQEALASKIGVSFTTYNKWERGKIKPSPLAMQKIKSLMEKLK